MFTKRTLYILGVFALLACLAGMAIAQSTTDGAIGGTITDPTGAVVAGATITVRNVDTNVSSSATADGNGRFRVINLAPGLYQLEASAGNFNPARRSNIIVEVGRVSTVDVSMGVSASAETAEVTAEAPLVNTQQQDFSTNVNQTSIDNLPINGRRWSQFALLTPGATPDGNFGLISFRGISGLLNNNTVDGGDNNNAFYSEEKGRTRIGYVISQASIQEFQVNTSNFSAEYGRAAGGVVNAVTKSGTNSYHGGAFWYYRNNEFGATNPFTVLNGQPIKPEDIRHQFGGNIGGPIIKDKLFFFFNYDQQLRNFPGVAVPTNPAILSASTVGDPAVAGKLACPALPATGSISFTGARASGPTAYTDGERAFCYGLTQGQFDAGVAYINALSGTVPRDGNQSLYFPKLDWQIHKDHRATFSYNRLRWESPAGIQTQPVVPRATTSWGDDIVKTDTFITKLNSVFGATISNELRFQYGRDFLAGFPQPPNSIEPLSALGLPVGVNIASGQYRLGTADYNPRPKNPEERRIQVADSVAWSKGQHLFKFGVDYNRVRDSVDSLFNMFGTYNYNTRIEFISDMTNPTGRRYSSYSQGLGTGVVELETSDLNLFVQDDWRIHPRLTLNLGVRYEKQFMPSPSIPNPLLPQTAVIPGDDNNIGPRIGFAWDASGTGKFAIRGGYGIYYGRFVNSTISSALSNTGSPGGAGQFSITANPGATSVTYPNVVGTGAPGLRPDVVVFAADAAAPMIHQYDAVFEYELARNTVVSLSYLGSRGRNLPRFSDRNLPATASGSGLAVINGGPFGGQSFDFSYYTGARPNATFGRIVTIETTVDTEYDALVAQFNRRLTSGLQFQVNYTFANSTDTGQSSQTFFSSSNLLDPNNLALESGRSNFDIRHRFVSSIVWQPQYFQNSSPLVKAILNDWTLAPVVALSSGRPFTADLTSNVPDAARTSTGILGAGGKNRLPTVERNSFDLPATYNVDLRLSRSISIREKLGVEFLVEAFNLFNHVNVTDVDTLFGTVGGANAASTTITYNPLFGTPTAAGNTIFQSRQLQWGVKLNF